MSRSEKEFSRNFTASLWERFDCCGPFAPLAMLAVVVLPLLTLSRGLLMRWQSERVAATGMWAEMLIQGVRADLILLGFVMLPLLLLAPILATRPLWKFWKGFNAIWIILVLVVFLLLEVSSPTFITEYDTRPNRLFVEYLKYPDEVFSMLWRGFRFQLIAGTLVTGLGAWMSMRLVRPWLVRPHTWTIRRLWLIWPLELLASALMIRSSLDHRPANPATFALSSDPMVNTLVLNSAYSVGYAIYGMSHEARSSEIYGKMDDAEIMRQVTITRELLHDQRPLLGDPAVPTLTHQMPASRRERPLNLVIVLE